VRGNPADPITELEAAIANVTRLLGKVDDEKTVRELVAERRALREELEGAAPARQRGRLRREPA
jgi:hypothetical protein